MVNITLTHEFPGSSASTTSIIPRSQTTSCLLMPAGYLRQQATGVMSLGCMSNVRRSGSVSTIARGPFTPHHWIFVTILRVSLQRSFLCPFWMHFLLALSLIWLRRLMFLHRDFYKEARITLLTLTVLPSAPIPLSMLEKYPLGELPYLKLSRRHQKIQLPPSQRRWMFLH